MDTPATPPAPREPDGKFAVGNPGGPGRPKGRRESEIRQAASEALTPVVVKSVLRKVAVKALEGNLTAARIVLERALGRPDEAATAHPLDIAAPKLRTAADCTAALQKVSDALIAGAIDVGAANVLVDLIRTQAVLIEKGELETRIAELERQAASFDFGRE